MVNFMLCVFCVHVQSLSSCPTLSNSMDCSLPGSSVHGLLQVRMLKWITISFSGDLLDPGIKPRSPALQADSFPYEPPGKPNAYFSKFKK